VWRSTRAASSSICFILDANELQRTHAAHHNESHIMLAIPAAPFMPQILPFRYNCNWVAETSLRELDP
jgi:hypothetical protein